MNHKVKLLDDYPYFLRYELTEDWQEIDTKTYIENNLMICQTNDDEIIQLINSFPNISEECRDVLYSCFCLFRKEDLNERINTSLKYLDSADRIKELMNDYNKELKIFYDEAKREYYDPFDKMMLNLCIRKTYTINRLDNMEFCLEYLRKDERLYILLREIDKRSDFNYFANGLERIMRQYKAKLYKGFYELLKKYNYQNKDRLLEAHISVG